MSKLFYDDAADALGQTITNSERTFKECAQFLFPHLKPESAYARLKNCLNPERKDENLSFEQIIALCDFCKSYDALNFMCDELNHERPKERNPADELVELQRDFVKTGKRMEQIAGRIEQLMVTQPALRAAS